MIRLVNVGSCVRSASRLARIGAMSVFVVWAVFAFVVATTLAATHFYTLPKPVAADASLMAAIESLRGEHDSNQWLAVHVLYAQCRCSRRILDHLTDSTRPESVREMLLLVGNDRELAAARKRLGPRQFGVRGTTAEALRTRFHIQSAPLLLVVDPNGVVRYAGGYSERKQGFALLDAKIIRTLVSDGHEQSEELPLFGCAVSKQLQGLLDPVSVLTLGSKSQAEAP